MVVAVLIDKDKRFPGCTPEYIEQAFKEDPLPWEGMLDEHENDIRR